MNKIIHSFQLQVFWRVVFFMIPLVSKAQDSPMNFHGLPLIRDLAKFQQTCLEDPGKAMIDLKKKIPGITLDLRYAGSDNFMHRQLYPKVSTTYLRRQVADSLAVVQEELNKKGLGLKIFDAYRPYSVTEMMWEAIKDERYVADPKKGSGHNRGISVDLTIIDLKTKKELDMGTNFDDFSDTAHHTFTGLPQAIIQNRVHLKTMMEDHGFMALETEWWHYFLSGAKDFELLDIDFKSLKRVNKKIVK